MARGDADRVVASRGDSRDSADSLGVGDPRTIEVGRVAKRSRDRGVEAGELVVDGRAVRGRDLIAHSSSIARIRRTTWIVDAPCRRISVTPRAR